MSLASLFESFETSGAQVASVLSQSIGSIDPLLFIRVDQGRQPLPLDVANAIATLLGTDTATVAVAAKRFVDTTNIAARTPLPPILGDSVGSFPFGRRPITPEDVTFSPAAIKGQHFFAWFRSDLDVAINLSDEVEAVTDQSGAGNNISENVRRPDYVNDGSGVKELPFIRFTTAGNDELDFDAVAGIKGTSGSNWSFIFVVNPTTINGAIAQTFLDINPGVGTQFAAAHEVAGGTQLGYFNNAIWTSIAPATTGIQILAFVFDTLQPEVRVYRNRALLGVGPYVPFDIAPSSLLQVIGGSLLAFGGQQTPNMDLYEVLMYGQPIDRTAAITNDWNRLHSEYLFPRYL